jgi:hypothetical protein
MLFCRRFYVLSSGVWGGFRFLCGCVGVPRSVWGCPCQVKGAFGVADAMPLCGTLDLRASSDPSVLVQGILYKYHTVTGVQDVGGLPWESSWRSLTIATCQVRMPSVAANQRIVMQGGVARCSVLFCR